MMRWRGEDLEDADVRRKTAERRDSGPARSHDAAPGLVRVWLLGRFEVRVGSLTIGEDGWRLRKAASLVKLLALAPDTDCTASRSWTSSGPTSSPGPPPTTFTRPFTSPAGPWNRKPPPLATCACATSVSGCARTIPCGRTSRPSRQQRTRPAAPSPRRRTGRRWTSTPGTCCRVTATRIGRRTGGRSSEGPTCRCSSSWRRFTKAAGTTTSP